MIDYDIVVPALADAAEAIAHRFIIRSDCDKDGTHIISEDLDQLIIIVLAPYLEDIRSTVMVQKIHLVEQVLDHRQVLVFRSAYLHRSFPPHL